MKIGIVTQALVDNYGGILQNYALQHTLAKMGYEPLTINVLPSLSFIRYLLYLSKNILLYPLLRKKIKKYSHFIYRPERIKSFIENNIVITEPLERYSFDVINKYGLDALVVGSDQVWRPKYNSNLQDMFLEFARDVDIPKMAYAASFGSEAWEYTPDQTIMAKELSKLLNVVSVREQSGVALCRDKLGVKAELVLDPTLLLCKGDYSRLCEMVPRSEIPFIASYVLDMNPEKKKTIDFIASDKGLPVKYVTASAQSDCSVEEWLSIFRDASYVVTDSYHGTVFSILFEKPIKVFINEGRGADRFYTLFDELGINKDCVDYIDYGVVARNLAERRQYSELFLSKWLR